MDLISTSFSKFPQSVIYLRDSLAQKNVYKEIVEILNHNIQLIEEFDADSKGIIDNSEYGYYDLPEVTIDEINSEVKLQIAILEGALNSSNEEQLKKAIAFLEIL